METIYLPIPKSVLEAAKLPKSRWRGSLKKELALQLYREGILHFASACKLADMQKIDFHMLLGDRKIPRQYDEEEYEADLKTISRIDDIL